MLFKITNKRVKYLINFTGYTGCTYMPKMKILTGFMSKQ